MFKKMKKPDMKKQEGRETIIAQGVKVEGDFKSQGNVIIDGEVSGSVETEQSLRIGESAKIKAHIKAQSAIVAGEVRGNILAVDMLELLSTSKVHGDIETNLISVAQGAIINGKVSMGKAVKVKDSDKVTE